MEMLTIDIAAVKQMMAITDSCNVCMLITTDEKGGRNNRPMAAIKIDDEGNCWFFASKSSGKLKDISANNKIQMVFANPDVDHYLEIHGEGVVICDEYELADKWSPLVNEWFPGGMKDPEVCLVKIDTTSVFFWDVNTKAIQRLSIKITTVVEDDQRLAA